MGLGQRGSSVFEDSIEISGSHELSKGTMRTSTGLKIEKPFKTWEVSVLLTL